MPCSSHWHCRPRRWSAVSEDEAKQLGTTLTLFGAEKAGNKEGTIPEYTGGLTSPPASYKNGNGIRPDPFPEDKPLYSIDSKNMDQYADKLSDGTKALLKKYPSFRIDVYPTRRTVAFPKTVLDNTVKNATRCKTIEDGLAIVEECRGGMPFPIPKDGHEVMWNHLIRFQGYWYDFKARTYYVDSSGRVVLADEFTAAQEWPYYIERREVHGRVLPGSVGQAADALGGRDQHVLRLLEPGADGTPRMDVSPGQRRVRVAPDFTYDTPTDSSGGIETFDDIQLFSGKMDRYDFKLVGKKEIIMPYNMYKANYETKAEDLLKPNHANPDKIRWELHRAWVVEATLKPGKRHIYSKRVFYWDEDWGGGVVDLYDCDRQDLARQVRKGRAKLRDPGSEYAARRTAWT